MRTFINLNKRKQTELQLHFPALPELFSVAEQCLYSHLAVSVFDHWLTTEEASIELADDGTSANVEYDKKLYSFCSALVELTELNPIKLVGRHKKAALFRAFTSVDNAKKYLMPKPYHHSNSKRFVLALPALDAIYFEGDDYTHHIYFKSVEKLEPVFALVKKYGLHILQNHA